MAIYNTASDTANTAVRAFLTKVGEFYLGRSFNTGSGKGKADWERITKIHESLHYEKRDRLTIVRKRTDQLGP